MKLVIGPAAVAAAAVAVLGTGCASTTAPHTTPSPTPTPSHSPAITQPSIGTLATQLDADLKNATSVTMTGNGKLGFALTEMDLAVTSSGRMSGSAVSAGVRSRVVAIGSKGYLRVTASALRHINAPAAACAQVCGDWLVTSVTPSQGSPRAIWNYWVKQLSRYLSVDALQYGTDSSTPLTVDGQQVWELVYPGYGTVYVNVKGAPYLVRITTHNTQVDYSQWNQAHVAGLPPVGKVISATQLAQEAGISG